MKLSEHRAVWAGSAACLLLTAGYAAPPRRAQSPAKSSVASHVLLTGAQVFQQQCARCHGASGEGTPTEYPRPLTGSQSMSQLAKYIAEAMPPGPKHCTVANAPQVAGYIYDAFYSPIAQERNRPARVSLSRLTVRQQRNAIADLIGSFRGPAATVPASGLQAEYFKARQFDNGDRIVQRVDPGVGFDFGHAGPAGGTFDPFQFSVRWSGSVIAPDTGDYEFVVHTDQAMRLWVDDLDQNHPLIDAWVKSGAGTEFRQTLYLVGGREYPVRLEFTKSTQGVDDTAKEKNRTPGSASIGLDWKRPKQGAEEPIPARCLIPASSPEEFVLTTPFPPDDRSVGYERGNAVSKEWDEATTGAALETADYVAHHLRELAGTDDDPTRLKDFCRRFVERALRRPLDAAVAARYVDRQFTRSPNVETAVRRVILLTLQSPRFLYREIGASNADPYAVASRLSFALWDSIPDDTLLNAAKSGQLATRPQIQAQAQRMANDPRAWFKQREFLLQWLKVDASPELTKDAKTYPGFTPAVATDLRTSLDLTLENVVRSDHADFRDLLLTDKVYLNGRLAALYGVPLAPDAPFQPVALDPGVRAGVLTHPYILSTFAYLKTSSPIHRGVLLTRNIMGRTLHAPPAAFAPLAAALHPDLTTRQRVMLQTRPATCQSCHGIINPLGFTLEQFDAIGKWRGIENGKPIDSTGSYVTQSGATVKFAGAHDLAQFVAESDETHAAFVQKFFQYVVKQPIRAYGPQELPTLRQSWTNNGYNIRWLMAEIATESALPKGGTG